MPRETVNQFERAYRAWPALTTTAANRTTVTYADLAATLALHPRPIRFVLGKVQDYCLDNKLPPLTIVVVNKAHRQPGVGFVAWDVKDLQQGYAKVYSYPWAEMPNPFAFAAGGDAPEQLADRLVVAPDDARDVYRRVQNRGFAQVVFRAALLTVYNHRCAFCGLSIEVALEAAHIIPWHDASPADRVRPSNGLLLCSTHHALFDAHVLMVDSHGRIICRQDQFRRRRWTDTDCSVALALHGRYIAMPADGRHRPPESAFEFRWQQLNLDPRDFATNGLGSE